MLLAVGDPGFLAIKGAGHGLEDDCFLSEQIRHQSGAIVIVDAEDLKHASV